MNYDLSSMTKQEVFDAVVATHLLTQNKKSMEPYNQDCVNPGCAYRGENGLKCAAGIFIPDEKYTHDMEGKTWNLLVRDDLVPSRHMELIDHLQNIHDHGVVGYWGRKLEQLARDEELIFSPTLQELALKASVAYTI